jgi:hypothetical protein
MDRSNVSERRGIGIWKLGDIRKGVGKETGAEEENDRHIAEM